MNCRSCGQPADVLDRRCGRCGQDLLEVILPEPRPVAAAGLATAPMPPRRPLRIRAASDLPRVDDEVRAALELDRLRIPAARYPTVFCTTLEDFYAPTMADLALSDAQRREYLRAQVEAARADAAGSGTLGVNLPGRGCFLNGWLIARKHGLSDPADSLRAPAALVDVVGTLVHEKHGHGFLTRHSALGRDQVKLKVRQYHAAERHPQARVDTPERALLDAKWGVLFPTFMYLEEGFASWVEATVLARLADCPGGSRLPPYRAEDLDRLWRGAGTGDRRVDARLRDAVTALFSGGPSLARDVPDLVGVLERHESGIMSLFGASVRQLPRYVLGGMLMGRIEASFGVAAVPAAALVAANIDFGVERLSAADLEVALRNPDFHANVRLARISTLPPARLRDPAELWKVAHDAFGYAPPRLP